MKMSSQESPEIQKYTVSEECVCGCHHTDREKHTKDFLQYMWTHTHTTRMHTCAYTAQPVRAHIYTHPGKPWKLRRERR